MFLFFILVLQQTNSSCPELIFKVTPLVLLSSRGHDGTYCEAAFGDGARTGNDAVAIVSADGLAETITVRQRSYA